MCGPDHLAEGRSGLAAALRVAVRGRPGVGAHTVAAALRRVGLTVVGGADAGGADVVVHVVAEVSKPEDAAVLSAESVAARPVLVVLNKADLPGGASAGQVAERLGTPVQSMSALLALGSFDERLDGATRARLRRRSAVDPVVQRLEHLGAAVRYRRLTETTIRLAASAVADPRIDDLLHSDETVAAVAAAAEAMVAAGPAVAGWEPDLRRRCAGDITRGALRRRQRRQEPV